MAGCRDVIRRGGSPPPAVCTFDVSARIGEGMMMRRVEIGYPSFWVEVMNANIERQASS